MACQNGETKVVELLLKHCNSEESGPNTRDKARAIALMWACRNGHTSVVQLFLNHSEQIIELNASNFYGNTAFMDACTSGHKGVVQLLLNHSIRIDLNARDKYGKTAFMKACAHGKKILSNGPKYHITRSFLVLGKGYSKCPNLQERKQEKIL